MLHVLDVSNANGAVRWNELLGGTTKVAGGLLAGVYVKASEGHTFVDSQFERNRHQAPLRKLHCGAYHFARPDRNPPAVEAEHFIATLGRRLHDHELAPAFDMEVHGHVGADNPIAWARDFNKHVHAAFGVWPIFYSYSAFINELYAEYELRVPIGGGLWIANYGRNDGAPHQVRPPLPWRHWRLHQFTSRGHSPGVSGNVDISQAVSLDGLLVKLRRGV